MHISCVRTYYRLYIRAPCFFHPRWLFFHPVHLAGLIDPPSLPALSRSWLEPSVRLSFQPLLKPCQPRAALPCTMGSMHAQIGVCVHPAGWSFRPSTVPPQPQWLRLRLRRPGQPFWKLLSPFSASWGTLSSTGRGCFWHRVAERSIHHE